MARRREPKPQLFPCRYCLDEDRAENLISPCICVGTMKYVHNRCLMRWYTLNPEIGLVCSVCKTECMVQNDQPIEPVLSMEFIQRSAIHRPLLMITFYHWLYAVFCISVYRMSHFSEMKQFYKEYQTAFTLLYLLIFFRAFLTIQQKGLYMQKWLCTNRCLLPLFHLYCWWLMEPYTWIGGVAGNLCCFQYFYVHSMIVEEMNAKMTFRFISRPPETLPSSSEPS